MGTGEFITRHVPRAFFAIAFLLLVYAIAERIAYAFGYTITGGMFTGGRLFEIAALLLVFVITLILREIREELRAGRT